MKCHGSPFLTAFDQGSVGTTNERKQWDSVFLMGIIVTLYPGRQGRLPSGRSQGLVGSHSNLGAEKAPQADCRVDSLERRFPSGRQGMIDTVHQRCLHERHPWFQSNCSRVRYHHPANSRNGKILPDCYYWYAHFPSQGVASHSTASIDSIVPAEAVLEVSDGLNHKPKNGEGTTRGYVMRL